MRLADRPRRFLRTTSTKTSALVCVGALLILHQEWFSGYAFQTLFRHLRHMCLPKHRIFEANIMTIFNLGSICGSLLFGWAGILKPQVPCAAAATWCS